MTDIIISPIINQDELEFLRGQASGNYVFNDEVISLLKKNFTTPDSLYLLAKQGEEFVGFCSIDQDWGEDGYFFLREILVSPNYHRHGIGNRLMRMCIDHVKNLGAAGVITETAFDNYPMQGLCEKNGFQHWENKEWQEGITYKLIF